MATCNLAVLIDSACANGFVQLEHSNKSTARAVRLQMLKQLAGDNSTTGELIVQACQNGFVQLVNTDKRVAAGVILQELCNLQA